MDRTAAPSPPSGRALVAGAGALYLLVAVALWWHVWLHPATTVAVGSADVSQDVWWFAWVPHALGQGLDPFFTGAMYAPGGVNLISNTTLLLPSLIMAPVTVLWGPLVSFNVAVTLAPALDALVMFVVLRRWVRRPSAAFVGGLFYGFGPFISTDLRYGHLNLTVLLVAPVLLGLLDRILIIQDSSPRILGAVLGLVVVAQFFVGTEMLGLTLVVAAVGLVVLCVMGRRHVASHARFAAHSLATAAPVVVALLVWPLWWFLRGPRHFTGAVWGDMSRFATSLESVVLPHSQTTDVGFLSGGDGGFLGVPLVLALLLSALVLWRRGGSIFRFGCVMTVSTLVLSLGSVLYVNRGRTGLVMPAWPLLHLPVLDSAAASRFSAFVDLFAALVLAMATDRAVDWARSHRGTVRSTARTATVVAGLVAVLAPPALASPWPYPTGPAHQPDVLTSAPMRGLPIGAVVREYPPVSGGDAANQLWQATTGIDYSFTDGYAIIPDAQGRATESRPTDAVDEIFAGVFLRRVRTPVPVSLVEAVRDHAWARDARAVVVLDGHAGSSTAMALVGAALGRPAYADASGAVWLRPGGRAPSAPLAVPAVALHA